MRHRTSLHPVRHRKVFRHKQDSVPRGSLSTLQTSRFLSPHSPHRWWRRCWSTWTATARWQSCHSRRRQGWQWFRLARIWKGDNLWGCTSGGFMYLVLTHISGENYHLKGWQSLRMYLWWSLCTLYWHTYQVRITIWKGDNLWGCTSGGVYVPCSDIHTRWELPSERVTIFEDVPLVGFMYLVFTRMPVESYCRWLRSLLLSLCYVFYYYYIIIIIV